MNEITADEALAQIRSMSDRELVAFWNVLQFSSRMVGSGRDTFREPLVSLVMSERKIPHEIGKRTLTSNI